MLFNVLSFLIVEYICVYYRLIASFILVFSRLFPLFSFFFGAKKGLNNRYIHTLAYYTKFFSNKKIYFALFI